VQAYLNRSFLLAAGFATLLSGPYGTVQARDESVIQVQQGRATYYGHKFQGRRTASGERFDQNELVAAHPSLPFGSVVRVTNLRNGSSTYVRVVDRGPARGARRRGVIIDLSLGAARQIGFAGQGKTPVQLDVLRWGVKRGKIIDGNREESLVVMY
jgi:rare lipoprotein A